VLKPSKGRSSCRTSGSRTSSRCRSRAGRGRARSAACEAHVRSSVRRVLGPVEPAHSMSEVPSASSSSIRSRTASLKREGRATPLIVAGRKSAAQEAVVDPQKPAHKTLGPGPGPAPTAVSSSRNYLAAELPPDGASRELCVVQVYVEARWIALDLASQVIVRLHAARHRVDSGGHWVADAVEEGHDNRTVDTGFTTVDMSPRIWLDCGKFALLRLRPGSHQT
jgi:hypothetical protein